MIELWGMGSPNVQKVLIALEELELPYELRVVDLLSHEQSAPEFAALTPNRRVPVIVDQDGPDGMPITVWESGAILVYLAEKTGRLMPRDTRGRTLTMQWLMFQMAGIGPMFGQLAHFRTFAKDQGYSLSRYGTEVKRLYDVVEQRLAESTYLGGDDYGIADIAAWPWLRETGIRGVDPDDVPHTTRWIAAIESRPAVGRAMDRLRAIPHPDLDELVRNQPDRIDRLVGRGAYARA